MALIGSLQLSPSMGIYRTLDRSKQVKCVTGRGNQDLLSTSLSSCVSRQDPWSHRLSSTINRPLCSLPYSSNHLRCHSFLFFGQDVVIPSLKTATVQLARSCNAVQSSPLTAKLVPAISIIIFTLWGLGPLMQISRSIFLRKSDSSWKKSTTNYVMKSYLQPILLWTGAILICRALGPITLPTEASQIVKQRSLNFVMSLSTVLSFAYCLSSLIQHAQKYLTETNDPSDARNMGFQFAGKAVYTAVWVAAFSLFLELLGFSTHRLLTAGGLGTVLLTLAGREIFTNFLSSAMIHATRPFVANEWIKTTIEGYEVSGTVEQVGWWSPTIIRGEDREAVHIPNHKFTVNVVRNMSQKTHWRIKTHLAISHLDVSKINNIVADMRKVLAKNPQVEQQKLHRRVFLDNVDPENQALLILISCFVKTSRHEEYLCVKEAILLDLLRVISHHKARLATPIRTIQKFYNEPEDSMSFSNSFYSRGGPAAKRPMLLIEPPYKVNGEDKSKSQARTVCGSEDQDTRGTVQPATDQKIAENVRGTSAPAPNIKIKETSKPGNKTDGKEASKSVSKAGDKASTVNSMSIPNSEVAKNTTSVTTYSEAEAVGSAFSENTLKNSENIQQNLKGEAHSNNDKLSSSAVGSQSRQASSEASKSTSSGLEENIVLGVALEGSKRTLPIEEELDSSPTPGEAKELSAQSSGHGHLASEKDEKRQ